MTIQDINAIGESEFWVLSAERTINILNFMDSLDWLDIKNGNLRENYEFCSKMLDTVEFRISCDDYSDIKDDSSQQNYLMLKIIRVQSKISMYRMLLFQTDANIEIQNKTQSTKEYIADQYKEFSNDIDQSIKTAQDKIEPHIIATILTIMGVFSAVITIIMSVVITSSSWLNNATGAFAVLAIIVPNIVTLVSSTILLEIVFSRKNENIIVVSSDKWNANLGVEKALRKSRRLMAYSVTMMILSLIILIGFSLYEIDNTTEPHTRYILQPHMYHCIEVKNEEKNSIDKVIEFKHNQHNYQFKYDDDYFHNKNELFFCEDHKILE